MPDAPTKPRVTAAMLRAELEASRASNTAIESALTELSLKYEDAQWRLLSGSGQPDIVIDGLKLEVIQLLSDELRAWSVGGILKQVVDRRFELIYGDGVGFSSFARARTPMESANNVAKLFSIAALEAISNAHDTDGQVVFLLNNSSKELTRVFLKDLAQPYLDGDDHENVWFVRREWTKITKAKPEGELVTRYYPTDICPANMKSRTEIDNGGGDKVKIDRAFTAYIWDVNKKGGWTYGLPNLSASLDWARRYTAYLKTQAQFAETLASIAWTAMSADTDQAKKFGAVMAKKPAGPGIANTTPGLEITPQVGASEVNFDNGAALAAMVAASAGLTVDDLLAKRSDAAAATMDPATKRMAIATRRAAGDFFKRIGKAMGAPNLQVIWPDLETESPFREAQMIISAYGEGLFDPNEVRGPLAQRVRIPIKEGSKAPSDVLIPNTKSALKAAADVAPKPAAPGAPGASPAGGGKVNGRRGQSTRVGKLTDDNPEKNAARSQGEVK
jgi:hypothetical protein